MEYALFDFIRSDLQSARHVEPRFPFCHRHGLPLFSHRHVVQFHVQDLEFTDFAVFHFEHILRRPHPLASLSLALLCNAHRPPCKVQSCTVEFFLNGLNFRISHQSSHLGRHLRILGHRLRRPPRECCDLTQFLQETPPRFFQCLRHRIHATVPSTRKRCSASRALSYAGGCFGHRLTGFGTHWFPAETSLVNFAWLDQIDIVVRARSFHGHVALEPA